MRSEEQVVEIIEKYFKQPQFSGFYTQREKSIQIGSNSYRADVVLYSNSIFPTMLTTIVECKREGYSRERGIRQLTSYLSATDTRLGIFAASGDSNKWRFFENYRRNDFEEITRERFEILVHAQRETEEEIIRRMQKRTEWHIEQEAQNRATESLIEERTQSLIEEEARKRVTQPRVWAFTQKLLTQKIEALEKRIANLTAQAQARFWWAFVGWAVFIATMVSILTASV